MNPEEPENPEYPEIPEKSGTAVPAGRYGRATVFILFRNAS